MAGRPKIFNEDEVLNKAIDIFWKKGYEATSIEDLMSCMNLKKGSLYNTFGSKRELFLKVLDHFNTSSLKKLDEKIKRAKTPVEGIRNFFIEISSSESESILKGCFFGNSVVELSNIDSELKDKAIGYLKNFENLLFRWISLAKKAGELETTDDAEFIARYLLNLWNGINVTRRMYPDKKAIEPLIKKQLQILQ